MHAARTSLLVDGKKYFFKKHSTDIDAHKHARTLISINTRTQPYSYEHLRETEPANPRY